MSRKYFLFEKFLEQQLMYSPDIFTKNDIEVLTCELQRNIASLLTNDGRPEFIKYLNNHYTNPGCELQISRIQELTKEFYDDNYIPKEWQEGRSIDALNKNEISDDLHHDICQWNTIKNIFCGIYTKKTNIERKAKDYVYIEVLMWQIHYFFLTLELHGKGKCTLDNKVADRQEKKEANYKVKFYGSCVSSIDKILFTKCLPMQDERHQKGAAKKQRQVMAPSSSTPQQIVTKQQQMKNLTKQKVVTVDDCNARANKIQLPHYQYPIFDLPLSPEVIDLDNSEATTESSSSSQKI